MNASFTLPWPPSVNAAYRSIRMGRGVRVLLSRAGRDFKERAALELLLQRVPSFGAQRVSVAANLYPPDRRRIDIDNRAKLMIDALMPGVIDDDSQIDRLLFERRATVPGGRIDLTVTVFSNGELIP